MELNGQNHAELALMILRVGGPSGGRNIGLKKPQLKFALRASRSGGKMAAEFYVTLPRAAAAPQSGTGQPRAE